MILVVIGSGYSYAEHRARNSPFLGAAPPRHDMAEALSGLWFYLDPDGNVTKLIKDSGEWAQWLMCFPRIGHMSSVAAQHTFSGWGHAGRVMGLAGFGAAAGSGSAGLRRRR